MPSPAQAVAMLQELHAAGVARGDIRYAVIALTRGAPARRAPTAPRASPHTPPLSPLLRLRARA